MKRNSVFVRPGLPHAKTWKNKLIKKWNLFLEFGVETLTDGWECVIIYKYEIVGSFN